MATSPTPARSIRAEAAPWVSRIDRLVARGTLVARRWSRKAAWMARPPDRMNGRAVAQPWGRAVPAVIMRAPEAPIRAAPRWVRIPSGWDQVMGPVSYTHLTLPTNREV